MFPQWFKTFLPVLVGHLLTSNRFFAPAELRASLQDQLCGGVDGALTLPGDLHHGPNTCSAVWDYFPDSSLVAWNPLPTCSVDLGVSPSVGPPATVPHGDGPFAGGPEWSEFAGGGPRSATPPPEGGTTFPTNPTVLDVLTALNALLIVEVDPSQFVGVGDVVQHFSPPAWVVHFHSCFPEAEGAGWGSFSFSQGAAGRAPLLGRDCDWVFKVLRWILLGRQELLALQNVIGRLLRVNEARILVGQFVGVEDVLRQHDFLVSHLFTRVFGFSASERDALMHYITTDELPQTENVPSGNAALLNLLYRILIELRKDHRSDGGPGTDTCSRWSAEQRNPEEVGERELPDPVGGDVGPFIRRRLWCKEFSLQEYGRTQQRVIAMIFPWA